MFKIVGMVLIGLERAYNKTVDWLEANRYIELGELRAYRETAIQQAIKKKLAEDAYASTDLTDDELLHPRPGKGRSD